MITIKLTPDQANELAWLLGSMNIEPVATDGTLINVLANKPVDHPLWPVLKQLRSKIALQPAATATCPICGKVIERSTSGGKPRIYCSDAHKQQAVRDRENERKRRRLMSPRPTAQGAG